MTQIIDQGWQPPLPDADTNGMHDMLHDVKDYTRRIHWWVRLFGVAWLVSLVLGIVGTMLFALAVAVQSDDTFGSYSGYSSYSACMSDPNTTFAECQRLK
ncbi:MAG TPA: hypothetical protein VG795_01120 [Acidimicrobiia bacterium]|nr:hypothetical protein [Acidimicrobiia bacterium]